MIFYPNEKGGGGKGFSHAERGDGAQQVLGEFLCENLKF